ncbi:phosphopantetheine-binding protein [Streptomyces sp. NPDC015127]|uniref:phosphopantetheine-binding protein n=1 Tax=Streptomyces sp. NPDC015127 TaxID=3364939 RepID=UPI0036FCE65E
MSAVAENIAEIMVSKFEIDADKVDITATYESMELDSLVLVELAVLLTKQYGVEVEDWEIEAAKTIENTAVMLQEKGVAA